MPPSLLELGSHCGIQLRIRSSVSQKKAITMNLNATLFAQLVVFFILGWFTMRFVWPPIIRAIEERTDKIASGLEYADKTKSEFETAEMKIQQDLKKANEQIKTRLVESDKRAVEIIEQAKAQAQKEAASIIEAAKKEAKTEIVKLRDQLRKDVSALAIHGAEEILKKEVDKNTHNDILKRLEAEL